MGKTPCCDRAKVKRGAWSPEEDTVLRNYIQKSGTGGSWITLPQKAGLKRCGKSCRLRWMNYLRPGIKHGCYSAEEDREILRLYSTIGSRWSVIASQLPGRTDNDVKNYWNTRLKKKLIAAAPVDTFPEVGPVHWLHQISNNAQFALPQPQQDGIAASSSTTSSVGKSYASVEEMESKSLVYYDDYYAGFVPSFFDN